MEDLIKKGDSAPKADPKPDPKAKADPKADPKKEPTKVTASDWRSLIGSESLKNDDLVLQAESIDDIAQGYINYKQGEKASPFNKEKANFEDYLKTSEEIFKIKEDDYKDLDKDLKNLAYENRVPAKVAENLFKKYGDFQQKSSEIKEDELTNEYKKELESRHELQSLNSRFKAGLKAANITFEKYKELFPGSMGYKPEIVEVFSNIGEASLTTKEKNILDEVNDNTPNDPQILANQIRSLSRDIFDMKQNKQDYRALEKELNAISLKYNKMIGKPQPDIFG